MVSVSLGTGTYTLASAIDALAGVPASARMVGAKAARLLRERRFGQFVGYVGEVVTRRNPYYRSVARRSSSRFVRREVQGNEMYLDLEDEGISRTLIAYGVHEQLSTDAFEDELRRLGERVDGEVTVLEIGANIGYFCLLEAGILGEDAHIYAIEPEPGNLDLFERNLELNGYEDRVEIERCAIGDRTGPAELELSEQSNRHAIRVAETVRTTDTVTDGGRAGDAVATERIPVRQETVEGFLAERECSPEAVNVVRMDVEGYEANVFDGMGGVLAAPGPTVVHVELHPIYLTEIEIDRILSALDENGFEIASVVTSEGVANVHRQCRWHGKALDVDDFDELRRTMLEREYWIELVVRK
ncbi:FkbM family methyltransferase [Halomarina pelagica]|uniref:FkbM family methyltransferase n=1 Tax=Halomarina pelagica TaxID=2961599 RepID=UPI0020C26A78|nr:FkbM family methyltransferase [Halomarina sp. BND7]